MEYAPAKVRAFTELEKRLQQVTDIALGGIHMTEIIISDQRSSIFDFLDNGETYQQNESHNTGTDEKLRTIRWFSPRPP
jgi:hypothetical protein